MTHKIQTPADFKKAIDNGTLELKWDRHFGADYTRRFQKAQEFVDSECVRLMVPYTPMLSGILYKSAILETKIGSGEIKQSAPYARYQYYGELMVGSITGSSYAKRGEKKVLTGVPLKYNLSAHPLAGKLWFERMKADKKEQIIRGAKK